MSKKAKLMFWICALSTLAAIGVHIYLTNHHYNFKFGDIGSGGVCNINEKFNCNRTTASSFSEVAGIPIAIFGGLTNFFLLMLLVVWRFPVVSADTQKKLVSPIKLIASLILLTSIIMGSLSLFALDTICPMCSATYALSIVTAVSAWMMLPKTPLFENFHLKLYPGLAVALIAFAFFIHKNKMREFGGEERIEIINLQFSEWKNGQTRQLEPIEPITLFPSPNAKMKIVEFADFLCGHCAAAYPVIHNFVKSHPDVELSFQAFPLDGACNPAIGQQGPGTSCYLAQVSHCAAKQGVPWATQKWIFENQRDLFNKDNAISKIKEQLPTLGLNEEELMSCVDAPETREIIRQQAKLGDEAGVTGTPSLYINGKKVPGGFSIPLLNKIYSELNK